MTHRQFVAFNKWLDEQEFVPSRADNYAMQIAMEVHRLNFLLSKTPPALTLKQFRLVKRVDKPTAAGQTPTGEGGDRKPLTQTDEARIKVEQAALAQMLGFNKRAKPPAYKQPVGPAPKQKIKYPPRSR